jgi:hypothetical protein
MCKMQKTGLFSLSSPKDGQISEMIEENHELGAEEDDYLRLFFRRIDDEQEEEEAREEQETSSQTGLICPSCGREASNKISITKNWKNYSRYEHEDGSFCNVWQKKPIVCSRCHDFATARVFVTKGRTEYIRYNHHEKKYCYEKISTRGEEEEQEGLDQEQEQKKKPIVIAFPASQTTTTFSSWTTSLTDEELETAWHSFQIFVRYLLRDEKKDMTKELQAAMKAWRQAQLEPFVNDAALFEKRRRLLAKFRHDYLNEDENEGEENANLAVIRSYSTSFSFEWEALWKPRLEALIREGRSDEYRRELQECITSALQNQNRNEANKLLANALSFNSMIMMKQS